VSPTLKRGLHGGGTLLAITGVVFVALRLHEQAAEIDFTRLDWMVWSAVAGLALVYGLANLLLALAWWNLLEQLGAPTSRRWAVKIYGISQIAKYVPGNIMHLAGRQALGLAVGLPGWALAKSTVWELSLIAAAGALLGGLALPLLVGGLPTGMELAPFLAALGGTSALLWRFAGPTAARALGLYAVFLAISGGLFVALLEAVGASAGRQEIILFPVIGAYVLAWLAGLVTPGAPAGVGVRELVLLVLLNGVVGEAELLLAILLGRLITVGGDLGFFGMSLMIDAKNEQPV
jgi:glycosyltransferase 2 family protein